MSFTVYLVRHGQTIFNKYNRMQGWSDSPLTEKGINDGHATGKKLANIHFANAYSSDTTRANRTANYILSENETSSNLTVKSSEFLREQGYGYYEGADSSQAWFVVGKPHGAANFTEILQQFSIEEARDFFKETDPFHDAEDDADFWARRDKGFNLLREDAKDGDNVLVVSHGTTIRSIVSRFAPEIDITMSPKNNSVTKLIVDDDSIKVVYFNHHDDDKI